MFFRIVLLLLFVLFHPSMAGSAFDGSRIYVWRSDVNTGGKCLSRAFLFEKVRGEKLGNSDVVADFGLGTFPVRKVLVSEANLDSLAGIIQDSVGVAQLSTCSTLKVVAEDSLGNRKQVVLRLDEFLGWITGLDKQTVSEFNEWFVLPLTRCCKS